MKNEKDKCSFLIPTYNDNHLLLETLYSVDDEDIHILIVDDGSEVRVEEFISNYIFCSDIQVLTFNENKGIIQALNEGLQYLKRHKFRYVFRIDAGDINVKGRVDKQLKILMDDNVGMLGGHVEYYSDDVDFIHYLPVNDTEIKQLQHMRSCFIHPSMAIDVFQVDGLYSEKFKHAEDYEFFLRVLKENKVKVGNLDEVVVRCLVRSDGISLSNRREQIFSVIKAQLVHFDFSNKYSYLGFLKSFILLALPYNIVENIKRIYRYFNRKFCG